MHAKVTASLGRDSPSKRVASIGRHRGDGVQPNHGVRVAEAEAQEGAQVPRHWPHRLLRRGGHRLRGGAKNAEGDGGEDQGALHMGRHLRDLC